MDWTETGDRSTAPYSDGVFQFKVCDGALYASEFGTHFGLLSRSVFKSHYRKPLGTEPLGKEPTRYRRHVPREPRDMKATNDKEHRNGYSPRTKTLDCNQEESTIVIPSTAVRNMLIGALRIYGVQGQKRPSRTALS